jgi:heparosan-N-sulfate-glucuronate 5-epimerase
MRRPKPQGETSFLSSAASLDLPVGAQVTPGELRGYYIDFTSKVTEPSWPPSWLPPRDRQIHCETIQWALGCLERHLTTEDERWLSAALEAAGYLAEIQSDSGGWEHLAPMPHTYHLAAPWLSALAQGEGASLFARLHLLTGGRAHADRARLALRSMELPVERGGVVAGLGEGSLPEEYPTTPPSFVLNGAIFALWGFYDVGIGLGDEQAAEAFRDGAETLAANITRWDLGYWSRYDLYPHPLVNVASAAYHQLHITQLSAMSLIAPDARFDRVRERFERYQRSRFRRARAFAAKAAFRLRVPRNRLVGHRAARPIEDPN